MVSKFFAALTLVVAAATSAQAATVTVDFEGTGAPCFFASTSPLTTRYAGQGVTFSGVNGSGGSILNQCGNFGFNARSGTDFYAYNTGVGTGTDFDVLFSSATDSVSIWGAGRAATLQAFDAAGLLLGSSSITASNQWQQLSFSSSGIARARLSVQQGFGAFDDLSFSTVIGNTVPEPGTLALACLALLGMAASRRRSA